MIKYLHDANLSHNDLTKLRSTKYLPAENDETHVYAPSELYFKDKDLEIFPFVRFLQWPASEGMAKAHRDFLLKLGVTTDPPLDFVMNFMEEECRKEVRNENVYEAALNYLTQRLGPNGLYEKEFARYRSTKFLPCIRQNLETGDVITEMQSPSGKCCCLLYLMFLVVLWPACLSDTSNAPPLRMLFQSERTHYGFQHSRSTT